MEIVQVNVAKIWALERGVSSLGHDSFGASRPPCWGPAAARGYNEHANDERLAAALRGLRAVDARERPP
jgi:hypothetical protein